MACIYRSGRITDNLKGCFRVADYLLGIPEGEAQRQEFGSLYAPASNGWSFAPRIRSHKIAAGSPNVNGMFANRLTIFT